MGSATIRRQRVRLDCTASIAKFTPRHLVEPRRSPFGENVIKPHVAATDLLSSANHLIVVAERVKVATSLYCIAVGKRPAPETREW